MLARLRSSAAQVTGRVAQWVTGVAASMLRSGYEAYTGMPVMWMGWELGGGDR